MQSVPSRRGFLFQLLGLVGAGAAAGVAVGRTVRAETARRGPCLWHNGRFWHTHEKSDHLAGTWDITWCYRPLCEHTLEELGTTEDGYRLWHLQEFRLPPMPDKDPIPPGAIDTTPPVRRYKFGDDIG